MHVMFIVVVTAALMQHASLFLPYIRAEQYKQEKVAQVTTWNAPTIHDYIRRRGRDTT
jgi:hypothetical protein